MKYLFPVLMALSGSLVFLIACNDSEIGNNRDVNPDAVYFDYKVWSEEGRENAVVKLQYRMGGPNGTTLVLNEPSKVSFDDMEIPVDSTRFDGAYYEVTTPLAGFAGRHTIVYTGLDGKEYKEAFDFTPFTLDPDVPEQLERGDLVFHFRGLDKEDYLRIWLSDTLFSSDDINEVDTVRNGQLTISREKLENIADGPINLQFFKEFDQPLKNPSPEGGSLNIKYGLKREFELRSSNGT
ncbi:MAG: hypothetical protein GC171_12920 [Terrimonas sp.]|nr:hypothetical protein [Terrimonas sp.]